MSWNYDTIDHILWPKTPKYRLPCGICEEMTDTECLTEKDGDLICDICLSNLKHLEYADD